MANPFLRYEKIEKRFGERVLLNIEEFDVTAGESTLISGDNGAGKTTLLKILVGLTAPDHADVIAQDVRRPWRRARKRLLNEAVYLHQTPYMLDASVLANVAYGLKATRVPRNQVAEKVDEALRWAGLDHLANRNARTLSGGERQRVALTRARIVAPRLLVLDEPTASMDQRSRHQTYDLIASLRAEGMAVVIASHDLSALTPVCDRFFTLEAALLLRDEQTFGEGAMAKVTPFRSR